MKKILDITQEHCPMTFVKTKIELARLQDIGEDAFKGCSGLTSVTIGSSMEYIYQNAFYNCTSVNDVVVHGIPSEKRILQEGDILEVLLSEGEPLENVPRNAVEQGFNVLGVEHVEGTTHRVIIQK